jgi:hypothetical protein
MAEWLGRLVNGQARPCDIQHRPLRRISSATSFMQILYLLSKLSLTDSKLILLSRSSDKIHLHVFVSGLVGAVVVVVVVSARYAFNDRGPIAHLFSLIGYRLLPFSAFIFPYPTACPSEARVTEHIVVEFVAWVGVNMVARENNNSDVKWANTRM